MTDIDRAHALALLRQMLLIRRFEEKAAELYSVGKIRGFLHLYIGEEAVAVGTMQALTPEDGIVATYREHGQALARGIPAGSLMAEMYGKANGCSRGRGGSMHFFDVSRRFYGGHAIVGGGLPVAVGLALADKLQCPGAGDRVLLRRRGGGRGRVPRVAQPGRAVEAPGPLPLREQPLRDGHRAGPPPVAARHPAEGRRLRHAVGRRRRHGRAGGGGGHAAGRRPRAARRGPPPAGAAHVSLPRPLHRRPGALPDEGGGRGVEASAIPSGSSPRGCRPRASWAPPIWPRWRPRSPRRSTRPCASPRPAPGSRWRT